MEYLGYRVLAFVIIFLFFFGLIASDNESIDYLKLAIFCAVFTLIIVLILSYN
jgi:hypothetical protein